MNKLIRIGLSLLMFTLVGCATTSTYDFAEFNESKPRSILILPVVNNSLDVEAPTNVLATLPRVIAENGFYTFPVNTVKTILEYEGLYDPAEIHARPIEEIVALFGADAILYVTIHSWTSKYILFSTTTEVDFEYLLKSSNGTALWSARKKLTYTPSNNNNQGNPMAALLSAAITAAIEKAKPNYLPLTRQANHAVFNVDGTRIPPGPYGVGYDDYYLALESNQP